MIRRLKRDLRRLGQAFPSRSIEPIVLDGLQATTPVLELARRLALYGATRMNRIGALPKHKASLAKLAFVQLQASIEECFGWSKTVGGLAQVKVRGLAKVRALFVFGAAAYNLVRLPKLLASTG